MAIRDLRDVRSGARIRGGRGRAKAPGAGVEEACDRVGGRQVLAVLTLVLVQPGAKETNFSRQTYVDAGSCVVSVGVLAVGRRTAVGRAIIHGADRKSVV